MGFKFKVKYADVEVTIDDYERGELDYVNSYNLPIDGEIYDTIEDLLAAINYEMSAFTTNKDYYCYIDGRIDTDTLVNNDNEEPSEDEIARWKKGEETLYNAHLCCAITMVPVGEEHPLSEEEAAAYGIYS